MTKVAVGIIGFGEWVKSAYLPALEGTEGAAVVAAVAARSEAGRAAARERLGERVALYADYRDLLADPAVEAVMVAVPNRIHSEVLTAAAQAGKALFFEPPLGLADGEAQAALAALEACAGPVQADFELRIGLIQDYLQKIEPFEIARIERIREKLRKDLEKYFETQNIDQNRFEQEIIYYLEKIDITEEKVRLKQHCNYFMQTVKENNTSGGKKLNFISQEVGREINTIGSKASDYEMQRLVVQMKDELEKIKEQLFNIL